jgi:hypothetical protein
VRTYDDALVVKGLKSVYDKRPVRNVRFSRCTLWCDWGRAIEIGAETCAPEIAEVSFEDCDIVRTTHIAMDIQHGDRAAVRDIRFQNIRVEIDPTNPGPRMQKGQARRIPARRRSAPARADDAGHFQKPSIQREARARSALALQDIACSARRCPSSFRPSTPSTGRRRDHRVPADERPPVRDCGGRAAELGAHVRNVRF